MKIKLAFIVLLQFISLWVQADVLTPSVHPIDFSRPVSVKEIMQAGQFGGLLYPTEDVLPPSPISAKRGQSLGYENESFGQAIEAWNRHQYKQAYQLFSDHIQQYPNSPWIAESKLHQGCEARYEGRMNEAEQTYSDIIAVNQSKPGNGAKRFTKQSPVAHG
ncbi:tetratricopeptide repeat protein [Methylocucumis oryzae]|uniref:Tetratricopeptide repeat protein n=1 Tax=Methylocucumis oryzae TaxID=1632867 RepID=A0A0F3IK58_9GAMM|nr:hypothetical protein [Methylocucumis oryzae]KJV05969.1 hypothetical protein VZ94_14435 [Methylocucumis oryzae]